MHAPHGNLDTIFITLFVYFIFYFICFVSSLCISCGFTLQMLMLCYLIPNGSWLCYLYGMQLSLLESDCFYPHEILLPWIRFCLMAASHLLSYIHSNFFSCLWNWFEESRSVACPFPFHCCLLYFCSSWRATPALPLLLPGPPKFSISMSPRRAPFGSLFFILYQVF